MENFQRATLFKHGKASSFHRTHGLEPGGEEMKTQASLTRPESKEQREREWSCAGRQSQQQRGAPGVSPAGSWHESLE